MKFNYEQAIELRLLNAAFAGFEKWMEAKSDSEQEVKNA